MKRNILAVTTGTALLVLCIQGGADERPASAGRIPGGAVAPRISNDAAPFHGRSGTLPAPPVANQKPGALESAVPEALLKDESAFWTVDPNGHAVVEIRWDPKAWENLPTVEQGKRRTFRIKAIYVAAAGQPARDADVWTGSMASEPLFCTLH